MERYDFGNLPNRLGTDSLKWQGGEKELPMWVADMDFAVAPAIRSYLNKKVAEGVYGYSEMPKEWFGAYKDYYTGKYGLSFSRDDLLFSLGVIPSVSSAVRALTKRGEKVAVFTPNYHIFYHSIENNGRVIAPIALEQKGHQYEIPWNEVEEIFSKPSVTLFLMSNPHNPSGKIFTKEELIRLGELARKNGVYVLSDEIHGEITEPGYAYVPYFAATSENKINSLTCLSPTKAWNIAGLQTSAVLAYDKAINERMRNALNNDEVMEGNFFSYGAAIAAYRDSRDWLAQVNERIALNRQIALSYLETRIPLLCPFPSHSTYLLWIDATKLKGKGAAFAEFLRFSTGLYLSDGASFSPSSPSPTAGFLRMNLATSEKNVRDALERLECGVNNYQESFSSL